ncbi:MAG TPA: RNA polymerase sigma factor [Planctomycetota bacterium]|nr:RNA polymerase sigma factor [Planctomycetota bacterium]
MTSRPDPVESMAGALPHREDTWVSMDLLKHAQAGDAKALDALLARYQDRLRRVVRVRLDARLRGLLESADVVQETLSAALTHIKELNVPDRGAILRWLTKIAENEMHDLRRRAYSQKRSRQKERQLDTLDIHPGKAGSPADEASRRELYDRVDRAVAGLPAQTREVILLRTYCDASWEDVAKAIGSPSPEAARKLHSRAMVKLARIMEEEER